MLAIAAGSATEEAPALTWRRRAAAGAAARSDPVTSRADYVYSMTYGPAPVAAAWFGSGRFAG